MSLSSWNAVATCPEVGTDASLKRCCNAVAGGCVPVLVGAYTTLDLPFQAEYLKKKN
jgi:hypothetical protein